MSHPSVDSVPTSLRPKTNGSRRGADFMQWPAMKPGTRSLQETRTTRESRSDRSTIPTRNFGADQFQRAGTRVRRADTRGCCLASDLGEKVAHRERTRDDSQWVGADLLTRHLAVLL